MLIAATPIIAIMRPIPTTGVICSPKNIMPSKTPIPALKYAWLATPSEPSVLISLKYINNAMPVQNIDNEIAAPIALYDGERENGSSSIKLVGTRMILAQIIVPAAVTVADK